MKVLQKTDEYTIYQKRSGRYAVEGADKKIINGDEKVSILVAAGVVKQAVAKPAPVEEVVVEEAPAEEVSAEAAPVEEAVAEEAPADETPAEAAPAESADEETK
jgi:hypothetical protein